MENGMSNFSDSDNSRPVAGPYSTWKTPEGDNNLRFSTHDRDDALVGMVLTGLCVGLPWLVGVLICVLRNKNRKATLTVVNVSLVIVALLQCLSSTVIAKLLWSGMCQSVYCDRFVVVWYASRHCGVLLHLLAALEFALCKQQRINYPLPIVLALAVVCLLFADVSMASNIGLGCLACILVTPAPWAALWKCCGGCKGPGAGGKVVALAVAVFGGFGLYVPSLVLTCLYVDDRSTGDEFGKKAQTYNTMVCLNNLRLVADACLFWLITRESNAPTEEQQEQDTNTDFVLQADRL